MLKAIKILILEDFVSDIFLIERQFKRNKLNYKLKHTDNKTDFEKYLKTFKPDIILSDYNLPDFNGLDALSIVVQHPTYIPFIIVTGALDEETAVACIKAGADDYLTKENLTRLVSAIKSSIDKRDTLIKKEKAEEETKQLAKELQTLIKTVNTPIFGVDKKGEINEWNNATEEITGFTKKSVLEKNFVENFIHEDQKETVNRIITDAIKGSSIINFEILFKTEKRYKKLLLNTTTKRNNFGEVIGVILIGQDITKMADYREELEQKIEERTKKLKTALEKEKELNELKSCFVSMASHEFRTPLSAIGFASGFLKKYGDRIDKEAHDKKLDKINIQVKYLTSMLDDILTIGKADARSKFKPETLKFSDFIKPLLEEVKTVSENSHEIEFLMTNKNFTIDLDPKLGRNIFINLLTNAIKYTPGKKHILFENNIENGSLISKVTDFGIGIPEEELEMVFTPFHRAKNTEAIQGTGLGLAIVKEAVEIHKGTVSVESKKNKGTTFTIKLPLK